MQFSTFYLLALAQILKKSAAATLRGAEAGNEQIEHPKTFAKRQVGLRLDDDYGFKITTTEPTGEFAQYNGDTELQISLTLKVYDGIAGAPAACLIDNWTYTGLPLLGNLLPCSKGTGYFLSFRWDGPVGGSRFMVKYHTPQSPEKDYLELLPSKECTDGANCQWNSYYYGPEKWEDTKDSKSAGRGFTA